MAKTTFGDLPKLLQRKYLFVRLLNILSTPFLDVTFGAQNAMLVMAKCYSKITGATWN
jgi:hypothetical protein